MWAISRALLLVPLSLVWVPQTQPRSHLLRLSSPPVTCHARSIDAVVGLQGATGTMLGSAKLRNVARSACRLGQHVGLRIVDARGKTLAIRFKMESRAWLRSWTYPPVNATAGYTDGWFLLRPHAVAWVLLRWLNWCGRASYPAHAVILLPANGGSVRARPGGQPIATPRCDDPTGPSIFHVSPVVQSLS